MMQFELTFNPVVKAALDAAEAVVALESTVITHGLPYPQNVETAVLMETAVREGGAMPATIGIIGGEIIVGLSERADGLPGVNWPGRIRCANAAAAIYRWYLPRVKMDRPPLPEP